MLEFTFMRYALIGVLLISPMMGMLGTMAVNNKMAFFSDALGHSALTGIALGVLLGIHNELLSMVAFGIFMALQPEDAIALRSRGRYTQVPEPTEEYIRLTRLEGIVVSVLCAVLLVVLLFAPT